MDDQQPDFDLAEDEDDLVPGGLRVVEQDVLDLIDEAPEIRAPD